MSIGLNQTLLQQAMNRTMSARPDCPVMPAPPGAEAKTAQFAAYKDAVTQWEKLVADWEQRVKDWEAEATRHDEAMTAIAEKITGESERYTRELFGAAYDDVIEYFDDQPVQLWNGFVDDIKQHFGLTPKPPHVPDNGICPECGHVVDEDALGKAQQSSTSSKTIGKQSKRTSPS